MKIELGMFAKPVEEQLKEKGYKFKKENDIKLYNKLIHSWNMLRVHSIATDSEAVKMATRLIKKLQKDIEKV